ncbi:uncharacterized protein LOC110278421 [Arachis duranensis]|uniref:Uncharacterized protein LOC110278421 n=1 Tax=Arachis duranensis TaxID=130453 RepID=A0A9C6WTJ2_ARADU|nr:uncharacterized protein LOC110278421 [Arachis duranensis]
MEKYFKRTSSLKIGSQNNSSTSSNKRRFLEFEVDNLIADPGQRPKISSYHPNDRDKVRCAYLQKGPCQPRTHDFPQTACGSSFRRFNPNWFDDYGNCTLNSKRYCKSCCKETTKVIVDDLGDELFAVLVNEARDISIKEQMSVCLRYVNKEGQVREHFLGLVHVSNTNALSLKLALESLLETYNLSLSRVRGQGYDGASNMQGEFNGLKTLILKENSYVFYVHCFAHQLQLALVTVAKKQFEIALLFNLLTNLCNVVGASCKRRDMLRDSQMTKTIEALKSGEISSGRGLNQETALKRDGDTRWGSHYGTILRLISLFPSVVNVLEYVEEDGNNSEQRAEACHLLNVIQSFEFIFNFHLMKNILGITNELSQALQRNDQDIVNAMALVKVSKQRLQNIRDDGWSLLLDEVSLFCDKHGITVPIMDDIFVSQGRSRRKVQKISNLHHFQVEIFYQRMNDVIELRNRRIVKTVVIFLRISYIDDYRYDGLGWNEL